jgi:hypothetical protein
MHNAMFVLGALLLWCMTSVILGLCLGALIRWSTVNDPIASEPALDSNAEPAFSLRFADHLTPASPSS